MSTYLSEIRILHIACAYVSLGLFVIRHVLNLRGVDWRKSRTLRIVPHAVDSLLLASAVALMFSTHQYPFIDNWLTVKLFALVAYILLGIISLKRGAGGFARRATFLTAAAVFMFIVSVARTHSPWGVFSQL